MIEFDSTDIMLDAEPLPEDYKQKMLGKRLAKVYLEEIKKEQDRKKNEPEDQEDWMCCY